MEHFPFEHGGLLPAAVIEAIWQHEDSPRRQRDHISPSMAGGCMREYAINRTHQIYIDPFKVLKMQSGTFWHEVLARYNPPGWLAEVSFPGYAMEQMNVELDRLAADGRVGSFRKHNGVFEYQIWPELWFSWQVDALAGNYRNFIDYKNTDCPVGRKNRLTKQIEYDIYDYPASDSNRLQLSIYAYGMQKSLGLSFTPVPKIWKQRQGISDPDLMWIQIDVPLFREDELVDIIRPNFEMFQSVMRTGTIEAVSGLPLDGIPMYAGKKCTHYCGVKNICDALSGGIRSTL